MMARFMLAVQLEALVDLGDVVRLQLRDHLGTTQFEKWRKCASR